MLCKHIERDDTYWHVFFTERIGIIHHRGEGVVSIYFPFSYILDIWWIDNFSFRFYKY